MTIPRNYLNLKKNKKAWVMYLVSVVVTTLYFIYTVYFFLGLITSVPAPQDLSVIVIIGIIGLVIYMAIAWSMLAVNSFPLIAWGITGIGALLQMDVIQLTVSIIIFFTYRVANRAIASQK